MSTIEIYAFCSTIFGVLGSLLAYAHYKALCDQRVKRHLVFCYADCIECFRAYCSFNFERSLDECFNDPIIREKILSLNLHGYRLIENPSPLPGEDSYKIYIKDINTTLSGNLSEFKWARNGAEGYIFNGVLQGNEIDGFTKREKVY